MKKIIILFAILTVALFAGVKKQIKYKYVITVFEGGLGLRIYYTDKYNIYQNSGGIPAWEFNKGSDNKKIIVPVARTIIEEQ